MILVIINNIYFLLTNLWDILKTAILHSMKISFWKQLNNNYVYIPPAVFVTSLSVLFCNLQCHQRILFEFASRGYVIYVIMQIAVFLFT